MSFLGKTVYLRHRLGFTYLEQLVSTPGKRWYCLELTPEGLAELPRPACRGHRQEARSALGRLREQWQSLGEQLEEAERNHDGGRVSALAAQGEQLKTYMRELLRGPHSEAERARVAVHKAIRRALSSIQVEHPALAAYLRSHLRLGAACSFLPSADPRRNENTDGRGFTLYFPGDRVQCPGHWSASRCRRSRCVCALVQGLRKTWRFFRDPVSCAELGPIRGKCGGKTSEHVQQHGTRRSWVTAGRSVRGKFALRCRVGVSVLTRAVS